MNSTFSRMVKIYGALRRAHGLYVVPLIVGMAFATLRTVVGFFMLLDHLLFPSLRRVKANRPIVLVGNPRTGTTFLQRFLSDNGFGKGMNLFLMLYPSLLLQKVFKPFLPLLEKVSPAKFHSTEAHETSLTSVETDDVGVLFRYLDGFFAWAFFLAFDEEDLMYLVDPKVRDTSARDFKWLETLWVRSLALQRTDRNIAKLFSLSVRLPQFMARFPEAQILYMARDPLSVFPSSMSLVVGVLDRAFGFWKKPEEVRQRWFDRMYNGFVTLLQRFHDDWMNGRIDKSRVYVVRYDRMMQDFDTVMEEMCEFLGQEMTPELRQTVKKRADKQRAYESGHKYDLAKFGLSEERIRKDCAFFYETFLPPLEPAPMPAPQSQDAPPPAQVKSAS